MSPCFHQEKIKEIDNNLVEIKKKINELEIKSQKIKDKKPHLLTQLEDLKKVEKELDQLTRKIKEKENQLKDTSPKTEKERKRLQNEIEDSKKGLKKKLKDKSVQQGNLRSTFLNNGGDKLGILSLELADLLKAETPTSEENTFSFEQPTKENFKVFNELLAIEISAIKDDHLAEIEQMKKNKLFQDQKKKYLGEIGIKNEAIKSAQTQIDNLTEENEELFQENESLRDELEAGLKVKQNKESRLDTLLNQRQIFQNKFGAEKEKVSNLEIELQKEQAKNADIQHKLFETEQEKKRLRYKNIELETDLTNALQKKSELRNRLIEIKRSHKFSVQKAQTANLCRDLIKYESIGELENDKDNVLKQFISQSTGSLIETVANCQQHLKITDLTKLTTTHPMPKGKSLTDLITFYHANQGKPSTSTQLLESEAPNETPIVNQIIQECELGLNQNSSLNQVIERINQLIKVKPPITKPVNQVNDTPFGESLEKIVEINLNGLEKELGIRLSSEIKQQIKQVANYRELSSLRNQEIKNYLEKNQGGIIISQSPQAVVKPFGGKRIVLVSGLVLSLLIIAAFLLRIKMAQETYSAIIKGSNNTKLYCCGNKVRREREVKMFNQIEKQEDNPKEGIFVHYCNQHQAEAQKSPYLFTEAEEIARREQQEKGSDEKRDQEKREREERLNNQKNLFFHEGRTDNNKEGRIYNVYLAGIIKNEGNYLFLVDGVENIPIEPSSSANENPEKDKPVENEPLDNPPNSLPQESINNQFLLQYFQKNSIKSIKLESQILIIEKNDNSISASPFAKFPELKGLDHYLENQPDKKVSRQELETKNNSDNTSPTKPQDNT
ncbi:15959_t:CDS:2 [Funneliformis geosporum]|nr:15959_t:CDS:2 [Funneliformis geosporum]